MMKNHQDIVFVYGALRSGTTVFRIMLDCHPQISNPGEMDFLFDYLRPEPSHPTGWVYDREALSRDRIFNSKKLDLTEDLQGLDLLDDFFGQLKARAPGKILSINLHRHIDRAMDVLPDMRVLHLLRDPRDVARSSIQMGWGGTLYHGVAHWIGTETEWGAVAERLAPEQVLEITYEDLFRDIDRVLPEVCAFFGVLFQPAMLAYHETSTYGPPDVSLTEQWKRKCHPQELAELEARAGSLMTQRGYAVSQPPVTLGGAQKLRLKCEDVLYRWRFGMERFGVVTFWAEKLTRWVGFTSAHQRYQQRMDDIITQYHLK